MQYQFGWKKDKYDKLDRLRLTQRVGVPDEFMLTNMPPIGNQGSIGSCVGWGLSAQLTAAAIKLKIYNGDRFSPTWIYNGTRFIEGTLMSDAGGAPRDAYSWIKNNGCLLDQYWPYDPKKLDTQAPPSRLNTYAAQYPIITYTRIVDGIDGICSAIASGYHVTFGCYWFSTWMNIGSSGILPQAKSGDPIAGGHETDQYGYSKSKAFIYGLNSWGTGWGKKGTYAMPFEAIDELKNYGGYDAYIVDVNWGIPQPPPPTPPTPPKPKGCFVVQAIRKIAAGG